MATPHTCYVDCKPETTPTGGTAHVMYASEPSSAAGRYQWEQNAAIKRQGRRAWRATGQAQSRACRVWDYLRMAGAPLPGIRRSRRFMASVGSPWSDAHTLRTFNARVSEMRAEGRL
ncbi:hypothetical protein SEA_ALLEB_4 [Microbacterium phage Alleb]|nr:hypothetical protein SEA_ALLEB_112 [Microbacterium phage Alleb]QAU07444.1 hypothetical protein SEA_ALLEB_4 [Microbacterium phage Alleb]